MREIPVDQGQFVLSLVDEVVAKTRRDDAGNNVPALSREGQPIWNVTALYKNSGKPSELLTVQVPGITPPLTEADLGKQLWFHGLVAVAWQMAGRSGISYRAESVQVVEQQKKAA